MTGRRRCCRDPHPSCSCQGVRAIDDACIHLSPADIIEHLPYVLCIDRLRPYSVEKSGALQDLLCIPACRNALRIAEGNAFHRMPAEIRERADAAPFSCRHDQYNAVCSNGRSRLNHDQPLLFEIVHLPGCCREENVNRGSGLDLARQASGGTEVEDHLRTGLQPLELSAHRFEPVLHADCC